MNPEQMHQFLKDTGQLFKAVQTGLLIGYGKRQWLPKLVNAATTHILFS